MHVQPATCKKNSRQHPSLPYRPHQTWSSKWMPWQWQDPVPPPRPQQQSSSPHSAAARRQPPVQQPQELAQPSGGPCMTQGWQIGAFGLPGTAPVGSPAEAWLRGLFAGSASRRTATAAHPACACTCQSRAGADRLAG